MLYREIIAVCSEIHTNHINTQCGQNVELLNVKLAVHVVTTWLQKIKLCMSLYIYIYIRTYNMRYYSCRLQNPLNCSQLFSLPNKQNHYNKPHVS